MLPYNESCFRKAEILNIYAYVILVSIYAKIYLIRNVFGKRINVTKEHPMIFFKIVFTGQKIKDIVF